MSRLIAFGCSLTYGHGLADCWDPVSNGYGPEPSELAWPNLLAKLLDRECVNQGLCGASNKEIWKQIVEFEFLPSDIVFINWSYLDRYTIFFENGNRRIGPWMNHVFIKPYFNYFHSEIDMNIDFNLRCDHVNYLFEKKNIKCYNSSVAYYTQLKWNHTKFLNSNIDIIRRNYGVALDGVHPDNFAHEAFAKSVYEEIKDSI
jgi:lysophospholipase L1-like esterase